ncbi:hypothetical protein J5N97_026048 [Dioscorea zingiberensis]|uniref:C2H2-type domain-containing protein n=1 Tax=Dioscorea zingiberensis TaxID=325984 RepID=A0A9D5C1P5_9LILI|nr:hypothetical protein J5N97_026048 [Dioscorea zingiberensis]
MDESRGSNMSSNNNNNNEGLLPIIKGKKTKRNRGTPPATVASSTSSSGISEATTEEEVDMANFLILLAQGGRPIEEISTTLKTPEDSGVMKYEKFTSWKLVEADATSTGKKAGFYIYECKTCNKCFPFFQALGGHRASHKKPKLIVLGITCSICGSEFSSGQALDGHMRRHWPLDVPEPPVIKRERIGLLSFDLNLLAPFEDISPSINSFPLAFSYKRNDEEDAKHELYSLVIVSKIEAVGSRSNI